MQFYIIGVTDDADAPTHLHRLKLAADLVTQNKGKVSVAWVQDERDPQPPGEAQYQRRNYL